MATPWSAWTVDGTYRALYAQPLTGYWRTWSEQLYIPCPDCSVPPQPILVDRDQLIALATELRMPHARFALAAPVRAHPPLTLDEARGLGTFAEDLSEQLTFGRSELRRLFPCCGRLSLYSPGQSSTTELLGAMPGVVRMVDQRIAAVQGPIQVLFLAGLDHLVRRGRRRGHLLVLLATGRCGRARRPRMGAGTRRVSRAPWSRSSPRIAGAAAGFLVATGMIAWLGPDGVIEPSARTSAIVGSIVATAGVLLVVGIVSALSFASQSRTTSRPRADRVLRSVGDPGVRRRGT